MPAATSNALLQILREPSQLRKLEMELAITMDPMEPFVKTTYILEGDGPLALVADKHLMALFQVITTEHYPNATALARSLPNGDCACEQQRLAVMLKVCVVPVFTYFKSKFENDLKPTLLVFKAARFFSPPKVNEIKPTAADIDSLRAIPYLNTNLMMDGLKTELPLYLAAAEDVSLQVEFVTQDLQALPVAHAKCTSQFKMADSGKLAKTDSASPLQASFCVFRYDSLSSWSD